MTIYDSACVGIFIRELKDYIDRGGEPPVIPPLEDIDLMDDLGEIAGFIVMSKSGE